MIHWVNLLQLLGYFILGLSSGLLATALFSLFSKDSGLLPLSFSLAFALLLGGTLALAFRRPPQELNRREGILLVVGT